MKLKLNKTLRIFIVLVFLIEAIFDGGAFVYSREAYADNNTNLSPMFMLPNKLMGSSSENVNLIRVFLLMELESILKGQDIRNMSHAGFMKILSTATLKKNTVLDKMVNPWFFMNEAFEYDGDIIVKARILVEEQLKTYFVRFSLDKDKDDGFIIKGVYPADGRSDQKTFTGPELTPAETVTVKNEISKDSLKTVPGSLSGDNSSEKPEGHSSGIRSDVEARSPRDSSLRENIWRSFKKITVIAFTVTILNFTSFAKSDASVNKVYVPDHPAIASKFLEMIPAETTRTYIRMSKTMGIDIKTLMAVELTEVNYKGVLEITDKQEAERMTSKKGAFGAWQLMPQSVKHLNRYIKLMRKKARSGEYIPKVDKEKQAIIKKFGFGNGIDPGKVDHNDQRYDADYNRETAMLILAINRYSLGRYKLVKNKKSKGWHFIVRGPDEKHGFDLEEALILTHNCSMSGVKKALRKGGPMGYREYLPGETKEFYRKNLAYRETLAQQPFLEKLNNAIYEAREKRTVVEARPRVIERSLIIAMVGDGTVKSLMAFLVFWLNEISVFMCAAGREVVRRLRGTGEIVVGSRTSSALLSRSAGKKMDDARPEDIHKTAGQSPVKPGPLPEAPHYRADIPYYNGETGDTLLDESDGMTAAVRDVGLTLSPPVERYTLYVSMDFCSIKEFKADKVKYGSRFDLRLIRKDNAAKIAENVLNDVSRRGIDPGMVVVQLPDVPGEDEDIASIEALQNAGIRFVILDLNGFKTEFPKNEEKSKYRENMYALMLLVRKISGTSDAPMMLALLRSIMENYSTEIEGKNAFFEEYLEALMSGDVPELIKFVLIYKPLEKLADDLGNNWDSKTLIFA